MQVLLAELMDLARPRVDYADARFVHTQVENVATRNGELDELDRSESAGIGVRVRVDGAWGFAATGGLTRAAAEEAFERALNIAGAQPRAPSVIDLAPEAPAQGSWATDVAQDPFAVSLEEKLERLAEADAALRADNAVQVAVASFQAVRVDKLFASSEGAL